MKSKTKILQHKPTDSLDDLPVAVIFFDNKQIYYLNKIGHKILGAKKPCDFTKHKVSVFDFLLPEFHQKIRANNVKILSGKPHERLEFTIRNLKGEILHMESSSNRIDFNGKKVIQTTIQEITKRKAQEQELKEVREQFKIISNNAHDIIYFFSYTPKPHYLYISPSVEKVLGYKVDNFYKDPFFINKKTIGKDNELKKHEKQAIAQQKNNTLKQKKVIYKMTGKDGKEIWMEDHILPIKDEKGKIKFVFGIVRNITDLKEKEKELNQKWSNYRELLNESPMAFFIHRNGFCEMCNKEATKILKVKSPEAILGKYLINYIVPHQRTQALERVKDVLMGKELDFTPYKIIDSRGKVVNIELKSVPIKYNGNNCVLTLMQDVTTKEIYAKEKLRAELAEEHNKGLLKEIDLRKRIEKKLIENESQLINQAAKLSAIFESSTHLVWTVNKNFELTYFNANYKNTFKGKYGIAPVIGQVAFDLIPDRFKTENKDIWHPLYRKVLKGEQIVFERRDKDNKGEEVYREVFLSPIKNENGKVFEIACLAHDITENKRYEKQSIEQASKIKAIFESGTHIMWTLNKAMDYTSFNQNFSDAILDLYGKRPEINKKSVRPEEAQARKEYEKIWNGKYEAAFNGKIVEFVSERTNAVGKKVYRQVYLHPIYNNKEVVEVSGMGIDITENKLYEEKITQSLKEKEVLLKEVHHRVKNNMQVISSILNLQSSYVTDAYALNLLKESQNRIKTMAYIHESLYQNKTFTSINFSDYISTLTNNILQSYAASIQKVKLEPDVQKIILNLDTSIPAGLIINELVTNSIKHAFTESNEGIIYINLHTKDNVLFLEVSDNGKGFPKEIDFRNTNSLGLQLVNTLVEQLNGKLELKEFKGGGTSFLINFPM